MAVARPRLATKSWVVHLLTQVLAMRPPLSPLRLATCFALALAPFAARLEAQGCAHQPDADPRTGPASQHPFGSHDPLDLAMANQSLVFRIDPAQLPAQRTLLTAIGFASVATRTYHFDELSIRLGHSSAPALNTTLALNFEGFTQLVMQVGDWTWSARADEWCLIGLTTPFLYDPALGQLVIQITTAGGASSGSGSPGLHSDPARPSVLQTAWRFAPRSSTSSPTSPTCRCPPASGARR